MSAFISRAERYAMVPEMHEFLGKAMTGMSPGGHRAVSARAIGRSICRGSRKMS